MPIVADTSQEASLRLHRAAEPLSPPDDKIVIQTGWPGAAGFAVSQALYDAYQADLVNPAPAMPNCRANAPCYAPACGEGIAAATGATAGTPGSWTPSGSHYPSSVASLQGASPAIVASPTTPWTSGQYVQTGTPGEDGQAHWDGNSWETGASTFTPPPAPTLTSIAPNTATVGAADTTITLTGTNFVVPMTVSFDPPDTTAVSANATVTSATSATAVAPASVLDVAGVVTVRAITPGGNSNQQSLTVA